MLKGLSPILSPELLTVLSKMGHGDEIIIADGNFPAESIAAQTPSKTIVRADGLGTTEVLDAILSVFPLDQYDDSHFVLMEVIKGDTIVPTIWDDYKKVVANHEPDAKITELERFAYYERAKKAYAIIATSEEKQYANIVLKKGCVR